MQKRTVPSTQLRELRLDVQVSFGKVLRKLRLQKKLSQEALAFESDLNRQFISLLERGDRLPSLTTLYKLSSSLGMSGSEFLAHVENFNLK